MTFLEQREERRRRYLRYLRARTALQYMLFAEESSSPTKDLARHMGRKPADMAQIVKKLRTDGYLTAGTRGRAGGRITEMAAELLDIPYVPESQDPPYRLDVKLEAQTKKDLIYQLNKLARDVEAM